MEYLFWSMAAMILYTYAGYPLLLVAMVMFRAKNVDRKDITPTVSIIIAAHNEEFWIRDKLENTFRLDYPKDKIEIIVASDASTDHTNEIVASFADKGVKLLAVTEHKGKTHVQNEAAKIAAGEILIFSDATTMYHSHLIRKIVRNFADTSVGAVGAELTYINTKGTNSAEGGGMYWRYERFMKRRESSITSLIGVSGCCYAVRASLYEPVRKDLISDFVIAHMIYRKGKRVVYEPKALCYEEARRTTAGEFKMRVRVAVRTIHGMTGMGNLLNPFAHGFYAIQIISHKIFRYMVPLFLLACFISNMIIVMRPHIRIYDTIFVLQIAFYGCAAAGWLLRERRTLFYVPYYFCVTNAAILLGLIKFLKGERRIQWNTANTME